MPKLTIELIPSTCHYSNVRTTVKVNGIKLDSYHMKLQITNVKSVKKQVKHKVINIM
jgi:hypothetical protein